MLQSSVPRKIFSTEDVEVGDFVQEKLFSDTTVYVVTKKTKKAVFLKKCKRGSVVEKENRDGNPMPLVWAEAVVDEDANEIQLRQRKTGGFGTLTNRRIRPARLINGTPVSLIDYRV